MSEITTPEGAVIVQMPDRDYTFCVYRGEVCDTASLFGYLRVDDEGRYVARTLGNADRAADIRRFHERPEALRWLAKAVNGVIPRAPRRNAGKAA